MSIVLNQESPGIWKSRCGHWYIDMLPNRKWQITRRYGNYTKRTLKDTFRTLKLAVEHIEEKTDDYVSMKYKPAPGAGRPTKGPHALCIQWTLRISKRDRSMIARRAEELGISKNELALHSIRSVCAQKTRPPWMSYHSQAGGKKK